ncbi:MAG TPA: NAD-dependent deacylase [bacterium]
MNESRINNDIVETIVHAKHLVAFSGAGISAESGIPTFRDPGGLWDKFDPKEVGTTEGLFSLINKNSEKLLAFLRESFNAIRNAQPNDGHLALSAMEKTNLLKTVITQNIDNLHYEAGNTDVIELHGNLYRLNCLRCGERKKLNKNGFFKIADEILSVDKIDIQYIISKAPRCFCGGIMRIDVVLFGESVQDIDKAYEVAAKTDVMLVVGTSGVVYPAASVPYIAKRAGAKILEVNYGISSFSDIADWWLKGTSATLLSSLFNEIKKII